MRRLLALSVVVAAAAAPSAHAAGRCGDHAWCDTRLSPDTRAGLLLNALTDNEKIALLGGDSLFGVAGGEHDHTGTSEGVPRIGLPTINYSDGPVGPRQGKSTGLPIPMAVAATFDPRMANLHAQVAGAEARAKGNDVIFAPTVNIMRTPRGGRTFEGYGEDPFLVSRLAVGWVQGVQSRGVIANVKHYAANNQEGESPGANAGGPGQPLGPPATSGNRLTVDAIVDERTLREIYLPHFEAAIKQGHAGSVMCSYNKLNGAYACENDHLLHEVLNGWGFKGYVLADYGAAHNTGASLQNGLDFDPWPGLAYSPTAVNAALASGASSMAKVDEHVKRIYRTLFAYGWFDRAAYKDDDRQINKPANFRAAQRIEEAGITLLRNRGGLLPLDTGKLKSIALIGAAADTFTTGGGSGNVVPFSFVTPRKAIPERAGTGVSVKYDDGSDASRAAALAKSSDVAVVVASDYDSEGADRACLTLECPPVHGDQDALISAVAAANPKTVVVLETGGPVLTPWRDQVGAIAEAWYPGAAGGTAIARVLFGDVDPGGRLPATFPRSEADLPTAGDPEKYPGVAETVRYKEGVLVGYRWFDQRKLTPAFPFGFGLSYTTFALRGLRVTPRSASIDVVNTGRRAGTAVPQLYLGLPDPAPGIVQPPRQLKGMRSLRLGPGRHRRITFPITQRSLSYWDVKSNDWKVAPGCYGVIAGTSSRDIAQQAKLAVGGAKCARTAARRT